ncbi:HmsD [Aggregatibacter kilianii]|uniref:HmsD n=1 Tax=Aggregatibacter kilianii TaxID=2025884 RepID=UPI000D642971|nr:HmsD [Aggregatibacter kilianii]
MSSSDELRKLMVINKRKKLPTALRIKSFILDILTWGLWGYSITLIVWHAEDIFTQPIIEHFFFHDVIGLMFIVVISLFLAVFFWSMLIQIPKKA